MFLVGGSDETAKAIYEHAAEWFPNGYYFNYAGDSLHMAYKPRIAVVNLRTAELIGKDPSFLDLDTEPKLTTEDVIELVTQANR